MVITARKFSFPSLRLKTSPSAAAETGSNYDVDTSPPYSPTPSEMERPSLHPQTVFDLRQACAIIVNETNPPDPDEEPDHRETMRKFEEQRTAKLAAQAKAADVEAQKREAKVRKAMARSDQREKEKTQKEYARKVEAEARKAIAREAEPERRKIIEQQAALRMGKALTDEKQSKKEQPRRYSTRRPPDDVPTLASNPEPRSQIPKAVAQNFEGSATRRLHSDQPDATTEPLESNDTRLSIKAQGKQREVYQPKQRQLSETQGPTRLEFLPPVHATIVNNTKAKPKEMEKPMLDQIRASIHDRPKTSAAATVDYNSPTAGSSKSTTRSNTEYEQHRPTSTAMTSAIETPGDDQRTSFNRAGSADSFRGRRSGDGYANPEVSAQAKTWQDHKDVLRRAEEKYNNSGRAARPGSKASKRSRRWGGGDGDSDYERPTSRAGSLSESIRSGLSYYMRPRASQDSLRSGRTSATGFSRSESRSSSRSRMGGNGWWKGGGLRRKGSWSSFRSSRPDNDEASKLRKNGEPNLNRPLPALPGLDQYRETKMHIGQLMKAGARGRKKDKAPKPDNAAYPLSQPQARHVRKESISNPTLRNSSMERTLHRYRESKIMQEPPSRSQSAMSSNHYQDAGRKDSSSSLGALRATNNNSRQDSYSLQDHLSRIDNHPSRQDNHSRATNHSHEPPPRRSTPLNQPISRSLSRQDTKSPTSLISPRLRRGSSSSSRRNQQDYMPPPPMIRGPSYQKELEQAVYPRPMEVNKGGKVEEISTKDAVYNQEVPIMLPEELSPRKPKKGTDMGTGVWLSGAGAGGNHPQGQGQLGSGGMEGMNNGTAAHPQARMGTGGLGLGVAETGMGEWERKGGLKGRVGRMFGGGNARVVDMGVGARRGVVA